MNRLVKRYIILFLVILIPLLAAYLVGNYGYQSEKFGQGVWKDEYQTEFLSFGGEEFTTEQKLDKFIKFGINSQYYMYDETPIFSQEIKDNNEDLFTVEIYRAIYKYTVDKQPVDRVQYLFFIYNVQYLEIQDIFNADSGLQKEIEESNVPDLSIKLYELLENDEIGENRSVLITESKVVPDYDADVDFKSGRIAGSVDDEVVEGDELVYVVAGFSSLTDIDWSNKTKVEINATVKGIKDDNNTDISTVVTSFTLDDFKSDPEKVDTSEFVSSYKQNLANADYLGWVFKNYLWWIGLTTVLAIGLITGSFYLVYRAEEENNKYSNKHSKKLKK